MSVLSVKRWVMKKRKREIVVVGREERKNRWTFEGWKGGGEVR